jgi:signal-transduction protein with cAMP-binding, CBS, and nucleotidyltransferase domain
MMSIPLFSKLSKMQVTKIFSTMERKYCNRGQIFVREGRPSTHLYIVYEGEFEQYKSFAVDKDKEPFDP